MKNYYTIIEKTFSVPLDSEEDLGGLYKFHPTLNTLSTNHIFTTTHKLYTYIYNYFACLKTHEFNAKTSLWILNYLTNKPQFIRISNNVISDTMYTSTDAPKGLNSISLSH